MAPLIYAQRKVVTARRRAACVEVLGGSCWSCGQRGGLMLCTQDESPMTADSYLYRGSWAQAIPFMRLSCKSCEVRRRRERGLGIKRHGMRSTYDAGCRCLACTRANRIRWSSYCAADPAARRLARLAIDRGEIATPHRRSQNRAHSKYPAPAKSWVMRTD